MLVVAGALLGGVALGAGDFGLGSAEAGGQVLGGEVSLGAALARVGLPGALVEAPGDEHPVVLGEGACMWS